MLIKNVKALCAENGITITELERNAGIGCGTIGRWTKSSPRVDTLKKVADYFGVTMEALISQDVLCASNPQAQQEAIR